MKFNLPDEAYQWYTEEIAEKLRAIQGSPVGKKRATVIQLAFARANDQPVKEVFNRDDTCAETIWYTKWKHDPVIWAAYEACLKRALDWRDQETAAIEEHYRRLRRQRVATKAAEAPEALAEVMHDTGQRGADRISAANALMGWADPEAASKARPAAPAANIEQKTTINELGELSNEELDGWIGELIQEAKGDADPVARGTEAATADEASAGDPGGGGAEDVDA